MWNQMRHVSFISRNDKPKQETDYESSNSDYSSNYNDDSWDYLYDYYSSYGDFDYAYSHNGINMDEIDDIPNLDYQDDYEEYKDDGSKSSATESSSYKTLQNRYDIKKNVNFLHFLTFCVCQKKTKLYLRRLFTQVSVR